MLDYKVEGRYFPNFQQAFTFALGQAEKMNRDVEVEKQCRKSSWKWCSTAHPPHYKQETAYG